MEELKQLYQQLLNGDSEKKLAAIKRLIAIKTPEAGKVMVRALKTETDPAFKVKLQKAIKILQEKLSSENSNNPKNGEETEASSDRGTSTEQIDKLRESLNSGDMETENKAFNYIVKNRVVEILPELVDISRERKEPHFTLAIIKVFKVLNYPEATAVLLSFLISSETEVILKTIDALKSLGRIEDAIAPMKRLLTSRFKEVRMAARHEFEEMAKKGHPQVKAILEEIPMNPEDKVAKVAFKNPELDPDLLPKKKEDLEKEKEAKKKEKSKSYRFRKVLEEATDENEINEAVTKLLEAGDAGVVEMLAQKIANEKNPEMCAVYLEALGRTKNETAGATLRNYLENPDARVRLAAVNAMNSVFAGKPRPMLERHLKDPEPLIRAGAIIGMHDEDPNACFLPLSGLVNATDEISNMAALKVIEALQHDSHLIMLHKFFHHKNPKLKQKASEILKSWQGEAELAAFILEKPDENFNDFMKEHAENKRRQQAIEDEKKQQELQAEEENAKAKKPFWKELLAKFIKK